MRISGPFYQLGRMLTGLSSVYIAVQIARIAQSVERTQDEMTTFLKTTNARLQRAEEELERRRKRWTPW